MHLQKETIGEVSGRIQGHGQGEFNQGGGIGRLILHTAP
jgi:hypothetical protein